MVGNSFIHLCLRQALHRLGTGLELVACTSEQLSGPMGHCSESGSLTQGSLDTQPSGQ